ncbi:MAG: hypothetical protein WCH99_04895 [Verrucomicrobiota bacterium]
MMLAELTGLEIGSIVTGFVFGSIGLLIAGVAAFKKTEVAVDQPISVEIIEELHERFADKQDFNKHVEKTEKELTAMKEIIRKEIPAMVAEVNKAGEQRIRRVHSRLDPLVIGVAQLCARQGIKMKQPERDPEDLS